MNQSPKIYTPLIVSTAMRRPFNIMDIMKSKKRDRENIKIDNFSSNQKSANRSVQNYSQRPESTPKPQFLHQNSVLKKDFATIRSTSHNLSEVG